jgi:hypothetical protein
MNVMCADKKGFKFLVDGVRHPPVYDALKAKIIAEADLQTKKL